MSQKTKIAIVGADASAYHLFNVLYKNDDRFEVFCFINSDVSQQHPCSYKFSSNLVGSIYKSIIVFQNPKCLSQLSSKGVEKVVISPFCLFQGNYVNMAALFMSNNCGIISPPFESLLLPPPKPLISFFSDTQFGGKILNKVIQEFQGVGAKPVVVVPMPSKKIGETPYFSIEDFASFVKQKNNIEAAEYDLLKDVAECGIKIFFVADFILFNKEVLLDTSFDLIFFVGYKTMPCFFSSHFTMYVCDDFTFSSKVREHPSYTICKQTDLILFCHMTDDMAPIQRLAEASNAKIVDIDVRYKAKRSNCFEGMPIVPADDIYMCQCNAQKSMAEWIAKKFAMKPINMKLYKEINRETLFYEPVYLNLPSLMYPSEISLNTFTMTLNKIPEYSAILSTAMNPINIEGVKEIVQVEFDIDVSKITTELVKLPSTFMKIWRRKAKK